MKASAPIFAFLCLLSSSALGAVVPDAPPEATAVKPGGFPLGDRSKIHTNLDLGIAFDSNPLRSNDANAVSDVKGLIYPGLIIDIPGNTFTFNLDGRFTVERYFGTQGDVTRTLNTGQVVHGSTADTILGGNLGFVSNIGRADAAVGFELSDTVARTPTFFTEVGTAGADEILFKQWVNRGQAMAVFRPGGGALEIRTGYANTMEFFDSLPNSQIHGAVFESKLRFLPKTAAVFAADMSFFSASDSMTLKSAPYNIGIGLQGQLTTRLAVIARVGFGDALIFSDGYFSSVVSSNIRTVIARAHLTYAMFDRATFSIGYDRHITPVILLNAFTADTVQARFTLGVGPRMTFDAFAEYEFRNFVGQAAGGGPSTAANIATADVRLEYFFFDYLSGLLGYQLMFQSPNNATPGSPAAVFLSQFTRHIVYLNANLRY
jgi:hypothetical protein